MHVGAILFSIIITLFAISIVNAACFYILVGRKITFKDTFKLVATASAVNKILFSASGYLVSSYLSRHRYLSFHKTLGIFLAQELLMISPWVISGTYFGAKLAVKVPVIVLIIAITILLAWLWKRKKFVKVGREIIAAFKDIGGRFFGGIPLVILNMVLFATYYWFLFLVFNFHPSILSIIRIVSLSFTAGYLSFAPTGIGFKDTALVLLLVQEGLTLKGALSMAVLDRVIVTSFWAVLGAFSGGDLISEEIRKRIRKLKTK